MVLEQEMSEMDCARLMGLFCTPGQETQQALLHSRAQEFMGKLRPLTAPTEQFDNAFGLASLPALPGATVAADLKGRKQKVGQDRTTGWE